MNVSRRNPSGMTLVELLVVTGLIVSLLGLTVAGMRPSANAGGQVRRSAQLLASAILAAQSRSLGKPEGAGILLDPDLAVDAAGRLVTGVAEAGMHPLITGEVSGKLPPEPPSATSAKLSVRPDNADAAEGMSTYRILLVGMEAGAASGAVQPPTAWLAFAPAACSGAIEGNARFRSESGQTFRNTIWPSPAGGAIGALLARYPSKSTETTAFERMAAVDLRFSGVGDDPSPSLPYGSLSDKGAIAVTFDSTGGLAEVMQQVLATDPTTRTVQPIVPNQPVYFLVALRADIQAGRNTLASDSAFWVAIAPSTGRVNVAANVPQQGTDAAALMAARGNVKQGISVGK